MALTSAAHASSSVGQWSCVKLHSSRGRTDGRTKQIPEGLLHKVPLGKDALILEDKVQVLGVVDNDAWRQRGHVELKGLAAKEAFAPDEPGQELVTVLEEVQAIADEGQRVWWFSNMVFWGFFCTWE